MPCIGTFLLTGVYDLVPLVKTYINSPLHMTEYVVRSAGITLSLYNALCSSRDSARLCSPQQHAASFQKDCHVLVAVGENDSPAFKQQAHTYVQVNSSVYVTVKHTVDGVLFV